MTVAELIAKLQAVPQDLVVTVDGYEGGVTEQITLRQTTVLANINGEWYYGEHEADPSRFVRDRHPTAAEVAVLVLSRWVE